ncbi:hypothetical protein GCM10023194_55580 [Planotetraspora phitsanulokensis]|uniref:Uncharacterized protein n=1 Tax=Planotetraspora phitsanulokensis TaxID=575192 RepID=A0A8J3UAK1_9ACTN|nr:hypothetical protein Pph01_68320 [Planotetraspora phitsanulokensis]
MPGFTVMDLMASSSAAVAGAQPAANVTAIPRIGVAIKRLIMASDRTQPEVIPPPLTHAPMSKTRPDARPSAVIMHIFRVMPDEQPKHRT